MARFLSPRGAILSYMEQVMALFEGSPGRAGIPGLSRDRAAGCLLGLAIGDALGTTVEFASPGSFAPVVDMVGGGPFQLKPGEWTDDTSMALCLAESLVECRGFDPADQMRRYVRWWREGHLSSTGRCFDIGTTTAESLRAFERTGNPCCGRADPGRSGNGALMRLAPVPVVYAAEPEEAILKSGDSSLTTHGAMASVDACRYFGSLIVAALRGADKEQMLSPRYCVVPGYWDAHPLAPAVDEVAGGSFRRREPPAIEGSGYVVRSLEAALWAFYKSKSYREGCLLAVNLGDDADTTAAIYGQIAGAHYGVAGLPQDWLDRVTRRDVITGLADRLYSLSIEGSVSRGDGGN